MVFRPDGKGRFQMVGRLTATQWGDLVRDLVVFKMDPRTIDHGQGSHGTHGSHGGHGLRGPASGSDRGQEYCAVGFSSDEPTSVWLYPLARIILCQVCQAIRGQTVLAAQSNIVSSDGELTICPAIGGERDRYAAEREASVLATAGTALSELLAGPVIDRSCGSSSQLDRNHGSPDRLNGRFAITFPQKADCLRPPRKVA